MIAKYTSKGAVATGVVLAAGKGRRMGRLGRYTPKACLPVLNQPLLAHNLRMLYNIGIRKTVIVVGHYRQRVTRIARRYVPSDMALRFVEQPKPRGIADALYRTRELVGEWIVLVMGDTYFVPNDLGSGLNILTNSDNGVAGVLSVRPVSDPELIRKECTVLIDDNNYLIDILEKPEAPWNNIKPCGVYFFTCRIFDAIEKTPPSFLRNEVEITDAIKTLMKLGLKVKCIQTIQRDSNFTYPSDVLLSNLYELRQCGLSTMIGSHTKFHPETVLEETIVGDGSNILAPVKLKRSLMLENGRIENPGVYDGCIIGPDFIVHCDIKSS